MSPRGAVLGAWRIPLFAVCLCVALALVLPFLVLLATSFTGGSFIQFPPEGFSLQWYQAVLADSRWTGPFWLSVAVALMSTTIAVFFGVVGALAVARLRASRARMLRTLFIVPIALPPIAYAVGLHGASRELEIFRGNLLILVIGEALLAMPYVFVLTSAAQRRMDPALRHAASTLGAPWPMIIWLVELPVLLPSILAGAILAVNLVFDDVVLALFLLPVGVETLPVTMLRAAQEAVSPQLSAAATMVSMLALAVLVLVTRSSASGDAIAGNQSRIAKKAVS